MARLCAPAFPELMREWRSRRKLRVTAANALFMQEFVGQAAAAVQAEIDRLRALKAAAE